MSKRSAELLYASVIIVRATALLFSKIGLGVLEPMNLLAVRFFIAFLILAVLFGNRLIKMTRKDLLYGAILGAGFFAIMTLEMNALRHTASSTVSFLENTAIVIVPLLAAAISRKPPSKRSIICAIITLAGVGLLTLKGGKVSLGTGEVLCICSAITYASVIILTDRFSRKADALIIGIMQVGFLALFATVGSFAFETPCLPQGGREWGAILVLALVCTCFGFTLQPVAQRYVSTEIAGQFCALNPLTASILGIVFLDERLGVYGIIGAVMILSGILIQNLHFRKTEK